MRRKRNIDPIMPLGPRWCEAVLDPKKTPLVEALFKEVGDRNLCPPDWFAFGACGFVAVAPDKKTQRAFIGELSQYAVREGFNLRLPHYSVSTMGLFSELDIAAKGCGGILVLDDLESWNPMTLLGLARRIKVKSIPVTVVGLANKRVVPQIEHAQVDALGVPMVFLDQLSIAPEADGASEDDLEVINRHRSGLGMGPIDPAAGWTPKELAEMAENIRKTGRMANPRSAELKRRLMR